MDLTAAPEPHMARAASPAKLPATEISPSDIPIEPLGLIGKS